MKHEWKAPYESANNLILNIAQGGYISFNSNPGGGIPAFISDNSQEETALCFEGKFFILNGDYRKQYEEAIEKYGDDPEALFYAVFCQNKKDISTWSTSCSLDGDSNEISKERAVKWLEQRIINLKK